MSRKEKRPDPRWDAKCKVCGEARDMHAEGVMPGEVFVDGYGIVTCKEFSDDKMGACANSPTSKE